MEKEIKIAAKLYECRDTAKSLAKLQNKDFHQIIEPYSVIIKGVMETEKLDPIPALLYISKTKTYAEDGMTQLLFMAALIEMIEPSK